MSSSLTAEESSRGTFNSGTFNESAEVRAQRQDNVSTISWREKHFLKVERIYLNVINWKTILWFYISFKSINCRNEHLSSGFKFLKDIVKCQPAGKTWRHFQAFSRATRHHQSLKVSDFLAQSIISSKVRRQRKQCMSWSSNRKVKSRADVITQLAFSNHLS